MMMGIISRLWSMSLQAGILILVVLAVRFLLKKYPKVYMYFLWMLVGIRLLCPVFVETPFSLQPENIRPDGIIQSGGILTGGGDGSESLLPDSQGTQADLSGKEDPLPGGLSGDTNAGTGMGESGMYPLFSEKDVGADHLENDDLSDNNDTSNNENAPTNFWNKIAHALAVDSATSGSAGIIGILAVVYLAGAGVFFLFYIIQYLAMQHKVSTAVRGKENVWFSDRIDSPFVLGIVRPRIIMPYGLKKQEGYHILRHEQTHIRHHDPLIRLIGTLCICLHWWNPLVWLAVFKMNQDMEMFCDESVLRDASPEDKKAYARTLLAFAEKRSGLSIGLAFGESHAERRVRNLAWKRKGGILVTSLVMTLTVFCMAAFMTIPKIEAGGADGSGTGSGENAGISTGNGTGSGGNAGISTGSGTGSAENHGTDDSAQGMTESENGFITDGEKFPIIQDLSVGRIEGQSFEAEFNPHGQVTFAAYGPDTELNPGNDVMFRLIQNDQVIYTFDGNSEDWDKDIWKFRNVAAVSFPDINGDGYTDVITICNYIQDEGRITERTRSEATIYTGREGRYFVEEIKLEAEYNNFHDQKTITDIQNFVKQPEYQDYFERTAVYGRWTVTEAIPPAGTYALSEEEMESFENTRLEYAIHWYYPGSYNHDVPAYTVENYRKETVSAGEFEEAFRTDLAAMGISAAELISYHLEGVDDSAPPFGQHFYLIDADNALIYYEGVFFRAVRD